MAVIGQHPIRLDLVVHPGDPVDVSVSVLDASNAAVSLTDWTCTAVVTAADGTLLHDFSPSIVSDAIEFTAGATVTAAWAWSVYAARLTVTGTPPGGGPVPIATGWVRLYKP